MLKALSRVAREAREAIEPKLTQERVAAKAEVTGPVISDFENADHWPERIEEIVAAYEDEIGLKRGELWVRAALRLRDG